MQRLCLELDRWGEDFDWRARNEDGDGDEAVFTRNLFCPLFLLCRFEIELCHLVFASDYQFDASHSELPENSLNVEHIDSGRASRITTTSTKKFALHTIAGLQVIVRSSIRITILLVCK